MKRSMIRKARTVLLSTATGFCCLSGGMCFGQDPASGGTEIQRRLVEIYAREGKAVPSQRMQSTSPVPQQRALVPDSYPAPIPLIPAGITAPVSGTLPVVTSAKPAPAKPAQFPKTERWPSTDPAPPIPAMTSGPLITPGPSAHPLTSSVEIVGATLEQPSVSHPLAANETTEPVAPKAAVPQHPLAESSFEMPIFAKPAEAEEEKTEAVFSPPIPPHEASDKLEAEWEAPTQTKLATPRADHATISESPFEVAEQSPQPAASETPFEAPRALVKIQPAESRTAQDPIITPANPSEKPAAARVVALKGCCPVTLRNKRVEVPGRAEHQSHWEGAVYHLASAEAKQRFDAHPEHYAPAHAGLDVTLTSHKGQAIPGSLQHAVWYRRQLYLFHDAESLKTFSANPGKYVE